jgi:F0F1-type ATP synthase delta subunit
MTEFEQQLDKERQINADMHAVAHLLNSPLWHDKDKREELKAALDVYEGKYGRNLLRDLEDAINEAVYQACERIHEGETE